MVRQLGEASSTAPSLVLCSRRWCVLAVALLLATVPADARVSRVVGGALPVLEAVDELPRSTRLDHTGGVRFRIDLPVAAEPASSKGSGPLRIGFHRDVPKRFQGDLLPRLDWTPVGDGDVAAALVVSSPNAKSLRVGVYANLPEGAQLRFFHPGGLGAPHAVVTLGRSRGTSRSERPDAELYWSPSVEGDAIGIEITRPSGPGRFSFTVAKVAHRFLDAAATGQDALKCPELHVDVQCRVGNFPAGLENAVARIEFEHDGASRLCSGTLLNDTDPNTFIPYLLTAHQCVSTAEAARTVQATWFYQRATCGAERLDVRVATTAGGAELLATSAAHDSSLLRIRQRLPANVYFAGWDATPVRQGDAVVGIHHPGGGVKRYSAGTVLDEMDSEDLRGGIDLTWHEGVTEATVGGSGGSALFRDGRVVGTLSGGTVCRSTDYRDLYGSFAGFFPYVCSMLDPIAGCGDGEHDLPGTAATIGLDGSGTNALSEGDVDYWRVAVPSPGTLVALTTGSADTVGALEDEDRAVLALDDDSGPAYNFRIEQNVQAGSYFIRVVAGEGRSGDYALHVNHASTALASLPMLALGVGADAAIDAPGDVDRWQLQLEAEGFAKLASQGDADTVGVLENEHGVTLAKDDDSGLGRNFLIERLLPAGAYVLSVSGFEDKQGSYALHASHTPLADVPAIAADGGAGEFSGTGGDYWRFDVSSPSVATLETEGSTDTIGALYTSRGELLAHDDDSGESANFRIEHLVVPGTYYVRVGPFRRGSAGRYTVHAAVVPVDDTDCFKVDVDGLGSGTLDEAGDVDTWCFEVATAAEVVAESTGSIDTIGTLEDGLGRRLQRNDDGGEGFNFRIVTDLVPGIYFLRVSGFGDAAGDYALRIREGAWDIDIGDDRAEARLLAMDEVQNSAISPAGDVDYWRVEVPSRGTLVVESEGGTDTSGTLEDALGTTLAVDGDSAGDARNQNFRIEHHLAPGYYFVRVSGYQDKTGDYALRASHARDALSIPWFPAAQDVASVRQGFARLTNRSDRSGTVSIEAIDDAGTRVGTIDLSLPAGQTVHFNSGDLERGNAAKGIAAGVGPGEGDWRLRLAIEPPDLDLNVLSYVRTSRGFLTSMHDLVPPQAAHGDFGHRYVVPIFNPASNRRQVSRLRLFNPTEQTATVTIVAVDDDGQAAPGGAVRLALGPGQARLLDARELEAGGDGLRGSWGDGTGKWELALGSSQPLGVMNLMATPPAEPEGAADGNLTNLSTRGDPSGIAPRARSCAPRPCEVPYFIAAGHPQRQGFMRIGNYSTRSGTVEIHAVDDDGNRAGPVTIALAAGAVVHFNSDDLERGNPAKGISGSTGDGTGDWRLEVRTNLQIVGPLVYARTSDGFLTSIHDTVRGSGEDGRRHFVPIFNPASNRSQRSQLRLVNPTRFDAAISIAGIDDLGQPGPAGEVALTLAAGRARTIDAEDLEAGHEDLRGRLGDGTGKWRLVVTSDRPVYVINTLVSPTGSLTNLPSSPQG